MKKILTIIALSLVGILGVTVITLAFVKQNHGQVSTSNVQFIEVAYGTKQANYTNGDAQYKKLLAKYNEGTKESILSALFQGAYSADAKAEVIKKGWSVTPTSGKTYLIFKYDSSKTLPTLKLNGKNYKDEALEEGLQTVKYQAVYIQVEDSTVLTKITVYISEKTSTGTNTSASGNYRVEFIAHTSALYDYILELDENGELF